MATDSKRVAIMLRDDHIDALTAAMVDLPKTGQRTMSLVVQSLIEQHLMKPKAKRTRKAA